MTTLSIDYDIYRENSEGDEIVTAITVTGCFSHGELETFDIEPRIELTEKEEYTIGQKLIAEYGEDWDEQAWQSEREDKRS